jgi:hypothetical protein
MAFFLIVLFGVLNFTVISRLGFKSFHATEGKVMKLKLNVTLACFIACASISATPRACETGTLATYIELGAEGCTLGGNTFANFTYSGNASGGATTIKADQIIVRPLVIVPEASRFSFSAPWSVAKNQSQDSIISYTIVLPCGGTRDAQLDLTLGQATILGIIGSAAVEETTNVGKLGVFDRCIEICQMEADDSLKFSPVSVVLISDHVKLTGGTNGASLNEFGAGLNLCIPCV